ncbi:rhodanese-like domain-containing protein [Thiotrichales bacterium HSG1]|nr:rhodanese-like domain-containing protein [Thiotrichales bacterium HSG1]
MKTLLILSLLIFSIPTVAKQYLPKNKQTVLGLYVTAKEAFAKRHIIPNKVKILDVRTQGEYIFVGHASMAINIPLEFLNRGIDLKKMNPIMSLNYNFVDEVKKRFNKTDVIMIICRSGVRSAISVNKLAQAGFKNVYNITDGFEGDKSNVMDDFSNGKRIVNGWKNSNLPWTYQLDPELVY